MPTPAAPAPAAPTPAACGRPETYLGFAALVLILGAGAVMLARHR